MVYNGKPYIKMDDLGGKNSIIGGPPYMDMAEMFLGMTRPNLKQYKVGPEPIVISRVITTINGREQLGLPGVKSPYFIGGTPMSLHL